MNALNRTLYRMAVEIREHLNRSSTSTGNTLASNLSDVMRDAQACQQLLRQVEIASGRGWHLAAEQLRLALGIAVEICRSSLSGFSIALSRRLPPTQPAVREIYDDLAALAQEFADVACDRRQKTLSVTTDQIVLEDVTLGRFEIRLQYAALKEHPAYRVIALEPHPAAGNAGVTHPHVRDEYLCEGEARSAIRRALEQGRICDFFLLVSRVLGTYNPSSPHVRLSLWGGTACEDCGNRFSTAELYGCSNCDRQFCEECIPSCGGCSETVCTRCLTECTSCGQDRCPSCLGKCHRCGRALCRDCSENALCEECHDRNEEREDQPEDPREHAAAGDAAPATL
jgi:hypothetical protein